MACPDEGKLDPAVIASLYVSHADELRRFLVGLLRDADAAGEVLQATFARAVEAGHSVQQGSFKSWLFRVAYNEAMVLKRRQSVQRRHSQQIADKAAQRSTDHPEETLVRFETVEKVRQAVAGLPAAQRQVVRMRVYEQKTFAVIAQELDVPLGTVLTRMRSALEKLRRHLGDE